jgi:PEP-CTERM motif
MSKKLVSLFSLCLVGIAASAKADTITDTTLNVKYTVTSNFTPLSGNTYNVFLTIDPTGFSQGAGFLTAFSLQFKTGSDISSAVSLVSASGGVSKWSLEDPGGLNSGGCDSSGKNSGDVCFQNNGSAGTSVPGGPYNFELAVTMPGTDALTAASDIKAAFNAAQDNSGKNLGLTSMGITIQQEPGDGSGRSVSSVPEPSTLMFLGTGALGLAGVIKRRFV